MPYMGDADFSHQHFILGPGTLCYMLFLQLVFSHSIYSCHVLLVTQPLPPAAYH